MPSECEQRVRPQAELDLYLSIVHVKGTCYPYTARTSEAHRDRGARNITTNRVNRTRRTGGRERARRPVYFAVYHSVYQKSIGHVTDRAIHAHNLVARRRTAPRQRRRPRARTSSARGIDISIKRHNKAEKRAPFSPLENLPGTCSVRSFGFLCASCSSAVGAHARAPAHLHAHIVPMLSDAHAQCALVHDARSGSHATRTRLCTAGEAFRYFTASRAR